MPGSWEQWGEGGDIFNPNDAIPAGARYMAWLIKEWRTERPDSDRHALALASYNAGLGNILEAQRRSGGAVYYRDIITHLPDVTGRNSHETIEYVRIILRSYVERLL